MDKKAVANELVKLAKDLTAMQGSRVFLTEADKRFEELKVMCSANAAEYARIGEEGYEAVQAYRKIYTMIARVQEETYRVIGKAF